MEGQLTNNEIAKVFAMYLGTDVRIGFRQGWNAQPIERLDIYNISDERTLEGELLLTPLSKITDEHAIEVTKIEEPVELTGTKTAGTNRTVGYGKSLVINCISCLHWKTYQYLIQQGYAVPLFFGLNHSCNGKDAIELGVAIDKTAVETGL
jgi:hypothetical protein